MDSRSTRTYNGKGHVLSDESEEDGSISRTAWAYEYDNSGNMLTLTRYYGEVGGVIRGRELFTYDDNGNQLTVVAVSYLGGEEGFRTSYTYTYDSNGNRLTEEHDYDTDGTVDQRTTYTYDGDNNLLSREVKNAEGRVTSRSVYVWTCN